MPGLRKSRHWDERKNEQSFPKSGYPYREGWPDCGPGENIVFEIVMMDGKRTQGYVDFTTQYIAEGLNWRDLNGELIDKYFVVAWKEVEEPSS
jgi:hypothetical protein